LNKSIYKEQPGLADRLTRFLLGTLKAGFSLYEVDASRPGLAFWIKENYHDPKTILKPKIAGLHLEANEPNKMMAHISLICGYFDTDLAHWLPYVRRRTQVIMGADLMPVPILDWFRPAQWSMGKRLDVVEAAKAFPHEEQSAKTNTLMRAFLNDELPPMSPDLQAASRSESAP
jgi:pimeloyl-ACP methyl ester carboxylesterase